MQNFIASLHLDHPSEKLKPEWALKVVSLYGDNTNNKSLLSDKNIQEIIDYATGDIDMKPFVSMYKSLTTSMANVDKTMAHLKNTSTSNNGIIFEPFPLITEKINSATAIIQKIPLEISCVATDALAIEKRESDIQFLKNKPQVEADLQEIADTMNIGKMDIGTTENSAVKYSDSPFGLDLENPEEEALFANLLYSLQIESSYETILKYFMQIKNILQTKRLEIIDQLHYAVSCHRAYQNSLTGLPDAEYVYPGNLRVPHSMLPDYSDNTHRILDHECSVLEMFDAFGDEIDGKAGLEKLINGEKTGYCACNNKQQVNSGVFDTMKVMLNYYEVKSVDWVGVSNPKKSKKGYRYFTMDEKEATEKIWAQNTYCFWHLQNTKHIFGLAVLGFAQRTRGQESFQNFTTNIYRSHKKSAVELAIGENKKAQRADIKLQHAVVKSLPAGRYIDMRFLRNGLTGTKDGISPEAMQRVLNMAMEQNVLLGDTTDFEGKNDGQFKPVIDLPGGLRSEITGYMQIIAAANQNISRITGINEQLTGQSANPEGLVGMQKLLINSSINALQYCTEAMNTQYQKLFSIWGSVIKSVVEEGGKAKEGLVNIMGKKKVDIIDGLKDANLHEIGVYVKIGMREEERARFEQKLNQLVLQGVLSAADQFLLDTIDNPRDKYAILAVKEQKFKKEQSEKQAAAYEQQQILQQQIGQNQVAAKKAEAEGEKELAYAKGQVNARVAQLVAQLGLTELQLEGLIKQKLQSERNRGQLDKSIATLTAKADLEQTAPIL